MNVHVILKELIFEKLITVNNVFFYSREPRRKTFSKFDSITKTLEESYVAS